MRCLILILLCLLTITATSQNFSESDIKKIADHTNKRIKGMSIGNGITAKGCLASGRTLIYHYEVPKNWEAPTNIKSEIISNLITAELAQTYFLNDINVAFHYYKGNTIVKKISINSFELSKVKFELEDYINIKDHNKSKGVNLKIRPPIGWKVEEGNRPNIIKKFTQEGNAYMILIKENVTFFSRNQIREVLKDNAYVEELINDFGSPFNSQQIIDWKIVTIDKYPTIQFKVKGDMERSGLSFTIIIKSWIIFYEDKIVLLQGSGLNNPEFRALEKLYDLITNSVIFPDQYN